MMAGASLFLARHSSHAATSAAGTFDERCRAVLAGVADVVALGITEHLPWDAQNLQSLLHALPLLGKDARSAL
ncbi:hypothetical protein [Roseibium sp.]|uniref:hypothetical protein n=1 Tax=Roseibium sp. TaxID=1936156 RepID=UPI003A96DA0C